ncbi:MAG: hypothetical protein ACXAEU_13650 [Candidatus Hodarchaeales archaeon]|jgi:hypothetical protein
MMNRPKPLIETVIDIMVERENAKKAKRSKQIYNGTDPDYTIHSADHYIRSHLWILQSREDSALGEVTNF